MVTVKRVKGVAISRPIEYGNITVPMELRDRRRDTPQDHTHKWTVFVRDPAGKDDLSYLIKKVVFKLHDTYPNSTRTIEKPPFEVTETGWGEFELQIRIFFHPVAQEKNLTLYHHIKLHPYGPDIPAGSPPQPLLAGQHVTSIVYDEVVFSEPTEAMFELLVKKPGSQLLPTAQLPLLPFSYQTELEEVERYEEAINTVHEQVKKVREKIAELDKEKKALSVASG